MFQVRYKLYKYGWNIIDWIFPPACGGCERQGVRWCSDCREKVREISPPICDCCGRPLLANGICLPCRNSPLLCRSVRSWAIYEGPVRDVILQLKYRRDIGLGETIANHLIKIYLQTGWNVNSVVPVPLGKARKAQRGYNQAELLAKPLALSLGLEYIPEAISRVRETRSQTDLTYIQRRENVVDAFRADRSLVSERKVLIVDDVTTSGSTLDACAKAIKNENSKEVYGLTVARAI